MEATGYMEAKAGCTRGWLLSKGYIEDPSQPGPRRPGDPYALRELD